MRLSSFSLTRIALGALGLSILLGGSSAIAQINVEGLTLQGANGTLNAGYDGAIASGQDSSHDLGIGGDAGISGYYYNPKFLSFHATSEYDRAQSNAGSTSLGTSKGFSFGSQIFGGSADPGAISYGQNWGQTGTYGLPVLAGLNSTSSNRDFGISWMINSLPLVKNLTVFYANDESNTTIPGLGVSSNVHAQVFGVGSSGYRVGGFSLGGGYEHVNDVSSANLLDTNSEVSSTGSLDTFHLVSARALPRGGSILMSAYRTQSDSKSVGESGNTATDEFDTSISSRIWRVPLSGSVSYNDNVYGDVLQELNAAGETVQVSTTSPRTGILNMSISSSHAFPYSIFVTGYANREEVYLGGVSEGATSFGANVAYGFGRRLKGLTILFGMHDAASQVGNGGGGLFATVNYLRNFGAWRTMSSFSYNQNVQTLQGLYTSSSMSGFTSLRHELYHGLSFGASAAFTSTVFSVDGYDSRSENATTNLSWLKQTVTATYAQSSGSGIVTSTGVVAITTPGLVSNAEVPFSGRGYGAGYSNSMVPHMGVSVGWSSFLSGNSSTSTSGAESVLSNVSSQSYTGSLTYNLRKLTFLANALYEHQGANNAVGQPSRTLIYYFGVSRCFKFF